jgi:hypothetical protein
MSNVRQRFSDLSFLSAKQWLVCFDDEPAKTGWGYGGGLLVGNLKWHPKQDEPVVIYESAPE